MTPVLLALLAAARISYAWREDAKTQVRAYELTDWSKEPRVFTAETGVRVYERPSTESGVLAELPFGVPVKVLQSTGDPPVELNGRADRWYRVASEGKGGYVFGAGLTSARFEDDFDGDGDRELATVAFESKDAIRVRFYEPKTKTETLIDVRPIGGPYISLAGGHAYPELVSKAKAGLPLVHVDSHVEACASFGDYWVSYRDGKPQLAMELGGISDPPTMVSYQLDWQPAKKQAQVRWSQAEDEEGHERKWTETWPLDGGVFVRPVKAPAE